MSVPTTAGDATIGLPTGTGPSVLTLRPRGPTFDFIIPFSAELSAAEGHVICCAVTGEELTSKLALFESVELTGLEMEVWVSPGIDHHCHIAIHEYDDVPDASNLFSQPVYFFIGGQETAFTHAKYELPSTHSFGRQLKGQHLGNSPPAVSFIYTSKDKKSKTRAAAIRGDLFVRCAGSGLQKPIKLPPAPEPETPSDS